MSRPWLKFYPRDWRGDQALRVVSLAARGLWIDMICIMHEATPYGHLIVGDQPVRDADLARLAGTSIGEVQALLVELLDARVARKTRGGVIYSKRMTLDDKRAKEGRKAKLEAIEKARGNPGPSRVPPRPPSSQKPEARAKVEGPNSPSTLSEAKNEFLGPKEVRDAFVRAKSEDWARSYIDPCAWQDVPERALVPATQSAARAIIRDARPVLKALGLSVLEKAA